VDRAAAAAILARLHAAQGEYYAGGEATEAALRAVLDPAIEWHVPGRNAIAGDYHGIEAVMAYFARRRDHAARTFRMHPGDILTGEGDRVAVLTDGEATIAGRAERVVDRRPLPPRGRPDSRLLAAPARPGRLRPHLDVTHTRR